jgi:hypothetical protein
MAKAKRKETTPFGRGCHKTLVKNTPKNQEFKFRPKNELRDIP